LLVFTNLARNIICKQRLQNKSKIKQDAENSVANIAENDIFINIANLQNLGKFYKKTSFFVKKHNF